MFFRGLIGAFLCGVFICFQVKADDFVPASMAEGVPSMKFYSAENNFSPQEDRVVDEFQARLIEDLFTRPMFDTQSVFSDDEEDVMEQEGVVTSKAQKEIVNDLLSKEFAKVLAQKDMLKLRETLRRQIHHME